MESKSKYKKDAGGKESKPFLSSEEYVNQIKECDFTLKMQKKKKVNHMQDTTKHATPALYIKTEFKTGLTDNLNDNNDPPEILKQTKAGANVPIPQTSIMPTIFPSHLAFLTLSYF